MEQNTLEITEQLAVPEFTSIRDLVNQALEKEFGGNLVPNGLSTGFKSLDKVTGGFRKGQLSCIAVYPGMGKTAFLLSITNNLAIKNNFSVAIFSAERSGLKIASRMIETETGMSINKVQKGDFKASEHDHIMSAIGNIAKAKIFLDDTPGLSVDELLPRARQLKIKHNVDIIIIDYLELLTTNAYDTDSRHEQLSNIVQAIRDVAKELNLPVVLFSQIPGGYTAKGSSSQPSLKDLPVYVSELSDEVMFLHRCDLYPNNTEESKKGKVEVIVAKNENLSQQTVVPLTFIESIAKFVDFS